MPPTAGSAAAGCRRNRFRSPDSISGSTSRARADSGQESRRIEADISLPHEIAHQWWGNMVGWESYRDQWLSEGFATYGAALYLDRERQGDRKFRELLR